MRKSVYIIYLLQNQFDTVEKVSDADDNDYKSCNNCLL